MGLRTTTPDLRQATLGKRDFERISRFVYDHLGIQLPPGKHTMVEGRLRKQMRELGVGSFTEYVDRVLDPDADPDEFQAFLDQITTNKTDLFREPDHFDHLVRDALPALRAGRPRPQITVWSAACSSGEEPYTLAMTLFEAQRAGQQFDFRILASDISRRVLERAARAVYPAAHADAVPAALRSRYLLRSRDGSSIKMSKALRDRIRFGQLNLMNPPYRVPRELDVIFCRNVLIYFDRATQNRVVDALLDCLRPGGFLYLGHSESAQAGNPRLDRCGPAVYRKRAGTQGAS